MEANVSEFRNQVSKNMGDYVQVNGQPAVESVGPYVVELYENILSRKSRREGEPRGAVSVSKKTASGYKPLTSNVFDTLDDAKDVYVGIVYNESESRIKRFVEKHGNIQNLN